MQHAAVNPKASVDLSAAERRKHPRTVSHTVCTVVTATGTEDYLVENLSVSGALIAEGPLLEVDKKIRVCLRVPLYPDIEVWARVRRHGRTDRGQPMMGIEFLHTSDVTEDHIQSALLSELERSHTHGQIPS